MKLGDGIKKLISLAHDKDLMDVFLFDDIKEDLNKLLEYKDKCEELDKKLEQQIMHNGFLQQAIDKYPKCKYVTIDIEEDKASFKSEKEHDQLKQDALLGEAVKLFESSNNRLDFEISLSDRPYYIKKYGSTKELLDDYKQQLEKGESK